MISVLRAEDCGSARLGYRHKSDPRAEALSMPLLGNPPPSQPEEYMACWVVDMTCERHYKLIAWLLNGMRKPSADLAFIFSYF